MESNWANTGLKLRTEELVSDLSIHLTFDCNLHVSAII